MIFELEHWLGEENLKAIECSCLGTIGLIVAP